MSIDNKKIDWDTLLFAIKNEKCVLFIGSELAQTKEGSYFNKALYELLSEDYKDNNYYFSRDDLFVIDHKYRITILSKIDKFLESSFDEELYDKLAFIPFHLVVSTSPDLFLKKAFEKNNLLQDFHYYSFSDKRPEDIPEPSSSNPLIYNMTGSTEDSSSLVITYKDLYSYLKAILGNKPLPTVLLNELKSGSRFIFLGFKFEKWYVQLLLALLYDEIQRENNEGLAPAINLPLEADEICSRQFNIHFVESHIREFVDALYTRCEKANMLRKVGKKEELVSKRAHRLVQQDNIEEAIELLFDYLEDFDQDKYDRIAGISARYIRIKRKFSEGVIDHKESSIELAKIDNALLDVIEEVKSMEDAVRM
ncbi:SIR2 family protein [Aliifodinibius sp. S!AR15-10]|uniref:SIR2 family protein n=1 Tax=Aliifodinibius sp. S!AR15-10 TaxID=2950437 RepID=UPI00285741E9|nr:SIR2 family protein [Aliifodinibius sp. S!AR15-10]MDR8391781.1 SIR2 family protein [Aliifodinibius sp. S!AR15-10]